MAVSTTDVDGSISLIRNGRFGNINRTDPVERQQSRLQDIMIVIEKERQSLEAAMVARLTQQLAPAKVIALTLTLHPSDPTFHAGLTTEVAADELTRAQQLAIETLIATEIFEVIQRRASSSKPRQWRVSVSANCRATANSERRESSSRVGTYKVPWPAIAAVAVAAAVLYLVAGP
jgi:hypothetical protein